MAANEALDAVGDYLLPAIGALGGLVMGFTLGLSSFYAAIVFQGGGAKLQSWATSSDTNWTLTALVFDLLAAATYAAFGHGLWGMSKNAKIAASANGIAKLICKFLGALFYGAAGGEVIFFLINRDVTYGPLTRVGSEIGNAIASVGA